MPYRRKGTPHWWVSYIDSGGKRVRRSTETTNRKEAEALEAKWKLEAFHERQWDKQPDRTFDELMLGYLRETMNTKRSAERDRYSVKQLQRVFKGMPISEIGPVQIGSYKRLRASQGVSGSTISKELRCLSAAINYARKEWGWEMANPVQGRCPPSSQGRVRWLSHRDAETLIAASRSDQAPWLEDFVGMGLATGMRSGEMLGLTWDRVDLGNRLIYLEPEHQKNRSRGSVPINERCREVLMRRFRFRQQHCAGSAWVFCNFQGDPIRSIKRSFRTACKRAGIKDFRPHDLRHTCAAWLVQDGVPLRTVCEVLRHKDIRTTMRYAHLAPDNIREAMSVLDARKSQSGHIDQVGEVAGIG